MARRPAPETTHPRPPRRKALGQHHLRDGAAARPLVDFLRVAGRTVIEIGPGGGALTRRLAAAGAARILAVELDPAWAFSLRAALAAPGGRDQGAEDGAQAALSLVVADALDLDWSALPPDRIVTGNLPYNVGTVLLERLLAGAPAGVRAGFLLQREVVDRIVAAVGTHEYGALTVRVAARARATRLGTLRPGAFVPPPKVESSFVGFELLPPPLDPAGMDAFDAVVGAGFGQRRKTLRNALGAVFGRPRAVALLATAGLPEGERAERLDLAAWLALARAHAAAR